jgi:hypothetical protein
VQVPSEVLRAHDWHAPEQAEAQQIPWAQKVLPHSLAFEQEAPLLFGPQLELTQAWPDSH